MTIPGGKPEDLSARHLRGWPVALALIAMYGPMYMDVYRIFWHVSHDSIAPVMLVVIGWLLYCDRKKWLSSESKNGRERRTFVGSVLVVLGLLLFVAGRSQFVFQVQVLSQVPLLYGLAFLFLNRAERAYVWFPIALLLFLVPVPGSVLDELLSPLKQWVSEIVAWLLYWMGYPVARSGVELTIGNYELLVADACSGLNSMIALSGVGLLYVYLSDRVGRRHRTALLLSILPIAFMANVLRVLALVLITYYEGDQAGRSFHNSAGYVEIFSVFGCFFGLDGLFRMLSGTHPRPQSGHARC